MDSISRLQRHKRPLQHFKRPLQQRDIIVSMRVAKLAAFVIGIAGLVGLPTASASAAAGSAGSAVAPRVNTSYIFFNTGDSQSLTCQGNTVGLIEYPYNISYVENECSVRIWLHQYADGNGKAFCVSEDGDIRIPGVYRQFMVSTNPNAC
jgi:hypothetical protein